MKIMELLVVKKFQRILQGRTLDISIPPQKLRKIKLLIFKMNQKQRIQIQSSSHFKNSKRRVSKFTQETAQIPLLTIEF